jgi:hypothetical protein
MMSGFKLFFARDNLDEPIFGWHWWNNPRWTNGSGDYTQSLGQFKDGTSITGAIAEFAHKNADNITVHQTSNQYYIGVEVADRLAGPDLYSNLGGNLGQTIWRFNNFNSFGR